LTLKENYALLTRGLGWEPSYEAQDDIFPMVKFERIKIHDWEKWEDSFRLIMDAYWKYQGQQERKLYAVIDAFQQNNGQLNVSDARYLQALKVFITGVTGLEYASRRRRSGYLSRPISWTERAMTPADGYAIQLELRH
jgi:phenol hydroxylase P3 protein